ncbi:MAG: ATP-binding protein, partial [Chitinivibrionales bacterium]
ARALRNIYGEDLKVVFIGPCISKKGEGVDSDIPDKIDAVLTFSELRSIFLRRGIDKVETPESGFDPPSAFKGRLFPVAGGLLETADIEENLLDGDVVATDGRENFVAAIKEFDKGALDTRLLEVLCCNGCIMGAGISKKHKPLFQRRSEVIEYVRERVSGIDKEDGLADLRGIDLSRSYTKKDRRIPVPDEEEISDVLGRMGKSMPEDELNCGACGYSTCRDHAVAILKGLAESEMCLPYSIEQLKTTVSQLEMSNQELASTQKALVQSEKLASMGQLAAGIAHEVNNPLGVVLMYSHLLLEGVDDGSEMGQDVKMIAEQADRCKRIVSGLLNFARQNKTVCNNTNIADLVKRSVKTFKFNDNIEIDVQSKTDAPYAEIDSDQISQSIVNLFTNSQDAMPEGGRITVSIEDDSDSIILRVSDTGKGIPEENREKIFDPFFTTKQIGMGTGLGLAVIYGIIKMHKGDIQVNSNTDPDKGSTGTEFIITLPKRNEQ